MAAGGSSAAKDPETCGSGSLPSKEKVRPTERVCSVLFTAPRGVKWQPAALVLLRSLVLVVQAPPQARRQFVLRSRFAVSFSPESGACGSGSRSNKEKVHPAEWVCSILFTTPLGVK
ncbi:hypothetical protein NDU88_001003 [Pleurodeles waltl]|uniref:Uncharacterized protein n=1 Tax=Pleurodeles waltl TaxID=8319 RepID=A0AAV7VZT5_PLEWA|nr:hypothetical protein NDU88_001003 [Pleurodeles waltl]